MVMRPMMVRRRPLLRAAAIGGTYAVGRAAGRRAEQQSYADSPDAQPGTPQASQAVSAQSPAQPGPPQGSTGNSDVLGQLSQLSSMHDNGALSDEEFAAAKAKILGQQ